MQNYGAQIPSLEMAIFEMLKVAKGDVKIAKDIFEKSANEIVLMVSTVVNKLGFGAESFDCVFSGAVTKLPFIKEKVSGILHEKYPSMKIIFPDSRPVLGALKMALKS